MCCVPVFGLFLFHTPESVGCLPDGSDGLGGGDGGSAKEEQEKKKHVQHQAFSFTRQEALRTLPVYLLAFDGFCGAIIGAGCSQVLLQSLADNGAVGVDIAFHVVYADGVAQMIQPVLAGWARDKGVKPKYILGISSLFIASVPFLESAITSPLGAVLYGIK